MDFFEALREKAIGKDFGFFDYSPLGGIRATIEALEEMMVGESIRMWLIHDGTITRLIDENRRHIRLWQTHIGTDGEEVVVMVFKKP